MNTPTLMAGAGRASALSSAWLRIIVPRSARSVPRRNRVGPRRLAKPRRRVKHAAPDGCENAHLSSDLHNQGAMSAQPMRASRPAALARRDALPRGPVTGDGAAIIVGTAADIVVGAAETIFMGR
ncbi:hypothetical protein OMR07_19990 [Methylobacterium organophilum]|nr:hypothetical protein [Methylobacterium organophilum]